MILSYKTVNTCGEKEIIIDKSRFIAYVDRAETEEEALHFIDKIKKKHRDASHNCSAYLIGEHDEFQKANDDGEPSGTAGKPILELLKKMGLKDTVVVVTRYFGGIKLGAGGLIRAYGSSAKEGVLATGIIERILHREVIATVDYTWHGKLENELNQRGYTIADTQFMEHVTMTLYAINGEEDRLVELLTNITSGQADLSLGEMLYVDQPYVPNEDTNDS
jgi:uncharacterized YigZ family protein